MTNPPADLSSGSGRKDEMSDESVNEEENPYTEAVEDVARRMQDWCENGTIHLMGHVPKTWDEDDADWWIGLAEVALAATTPSVPGDADAGRLAELMRLMDEAYDHYFANSDGHCKSAEGHVSVSFGHYWDRKEGADPLAITDVSVYSYVLGPHRSHDFNSVAEALAAVRAWHKAEMEHSYDDE